MLKECCGTPAYMAPEVVATQSQPKKGSRTKEIVGYTKSCDIWSAGVVLYAMLYGTLPFKGLTPREIKDRVLKGKYILKKSISDAARSLIEAMMCVDVNKRITLHDIL